MVTLPCPAAAVRSAAAPSCGRAGSSAARSGVDDGDGVQPARATARAVHSAGASGTRKQDLLLHGRGPPVG
ncbi:hypothetical protein G6F61_015271 [Rhizopus arrhizus]|nr:hypothetical protein G6F61_015271 [Rhizopus arrhizus]